MKPILSICIPTYNRADWLRSSLWNWLPQVKATNGLVELIVSDNASEDNTEFVIDEASEFGPFRHYRNDQNVGVMRNIYRLTSKLAEGQFVWVVGDDDLPRGDAVERVIAVLQTHPELKYVYVNYSHWQPEEAPREVIMSSDLDFSRAASTDFKDRFVNKISELVAVEVGCFTPIYCSVWQREIASSAFELGSKSEVFSSLEGTLPHAIFIIENLLNEPAWYIGYPCILASYQVRWFMDVPTQKLEYMPKIYDICEKAGVSRSVLDKHRRKMLIGVGTNLLPKVVGKSQLATHNKISFWTFLKFFKRNYRFLEFLR